MMVFFEKSQPAPDCLAIEKAKNNGDYKCGDVLDRLQADFNNKCYICELKKPSSINVEHFIPHQGDKDLQFDWNNLFFSCAHCNNTKLANYTNILDCTKLTDYVGLKLKYLVEPFPSEKVSIEALLNNSKVLETKALLEAVYNGTTKLKMLESANLRDALLKEIRDFQEALCEYSNNENSEDDKNYFLDKIKKHLHKGSSFTAFKRWIIFENEALYKDFSQYIID